MIHRSDIQRRCVIEATISPLIRYRRGYARSKMGPFYYKPTIAYLIEIGDLRPAWGNTKRALTALTKPTQAIADKGQPTIEDILRAADKPNRKNTADLAGEG